MQKCSRCNTNLPEVKNGWVKCPKCGLTKFNGKSKKIDQNQKNNVGEKENLEKGKKEALKKEKEAKA